MIYYEAFICYCFLKFLNMKCNFITLFLGIFIYGSINAQEVSINNHIKDLYTKQNTFLMKAKQEFSVSNGVFYDDGGPSSNVSDNYSIATFSGNNEILEIYFEEFNIPYDAKIKVYDGISNKGKLLGVFTSKDKPWNFKAKNLTVEYIASASNAPGKGWKGVLRTSKVTKNNAIQSAPESDCPNAIPLCTNNTAIVSASQYVDLGSINDDSGSCYGGTGSGGSVWYSFSPQATGPLDF